MQTNITSFFKNNKLNTVTPILSNKTNKIQKQNLNDNFVLYFDGCSKKNPGPSGAGAVIYNNDIEIWKRSLFVGKKSTNNVAEYTGMIIGIEHAKQLGIKKLTIKGDSNLVIQQMNGKFNVTAPHILKLYNQARSILSYFDSVSFIHVYRHFNQRADELANLAL